ncbi:hypothetical protein REPUB_Repub20aG0022000 [Reevesia pubescens]
MFEKLFQADWKPESPDKFGEIAELIKSVDSLKIEETKLQGQGSTSKKPASANAPAQKPAAYRPPHAKNAAAVQAETISYRVAPGTLSPHLYLALPSHYLQYDCIIRITFLSFWIALCDPDSLNDCVIAVVWREFYRRNEQECTEKQEEEGETKKRKRRLRQLMLHDKVQFYPKAIKLYKPGYLAVLISAVCCLRLPLLSTACVAAAVWRLQLVLLAAAVSLLPCFLRPF